MKILHISTMDSGGAGRAACWLHQGLLRAGVESRVLCREMAQHQEGVEQYDIAPWRYRLMMAWRFKNVLGKAVEAQRTNNLTFGGCPWYSPRPSSTKGNHETNNSPLDHWNAGVYFQTQAGRADTGG